MGPVFSVNLSLRERVVALIPTCNVNCTCKVHWDQAEVLDRKLNQSHQWLCSSRAKLAPHTVQVAEQPNVAAEQQARIR
jgi:hypothetical protein